jgi:hypothetical protein
MLLSLGLQIGLHNGQTIYRERNVAVEDPDARETFITRALVELQHCCPDAARPTPAQLKATLLLALEAQEAALGGYSPTSVDEAPPTTGVDDLLDGAPKSVHRPLSLVDNHAYAVAWPYHRGRRVCVIVRDDGELFTDAPLSDAHTLEQLGLTTRFDADNAPDDSRTWSGAGVKRYRSGERPNPADVFARISAVVDTFLDFRRSLADQSVMIELVACYIMATYLLDAFSAFGYLWANGDKGSGKTNLLLVVTEIGYLGRLVIPAGN